MRKLTDKELLQVIGGLSISGALINSLTKGIEVILDLGRSIGTAIRRINEKKLCQL